MLVTMKQIYHVQLPVVNKPHRLFLTESCSPSMGVPSCHLPSPIGPNGPQLPQTIDHNGVSTPAGVAPFGILSQFSDQTRPHAQSGAYIVGGRQTAVSPPYYLVGPNIFYPFINSSNLSLIQSYDQVDSDVPPSANNVPNQDRHQIIHSFNQTVDSNTSQAPFSSTTPRYTKPTSDLCTSPRANNVLGVKEYKVNPGSALTIHTNVFQGAFPPALTQPPLPRDTSPPQMYHPAEAPVLTPAKSAASTPTTPSTPHDCTIPCGWKVNGVLCGVDITYDCQHHLATVHGITNMQAQTLVRCGWCGRLKRRGCLLRHVREVHLRVPRWNKACT